MITLKDTLLSAIGSGNLALFQYICKDCEITTDDVAAINRDPFRRTCGNLKMVIDEIVI